MARFLETHPNVRITCDVGPRGRALDRLSAGEIDLAVSSLRIPRRAIEYRHFSDDLLVLLVPLDHPWAGRSSIHYTELGEYPLISRETGSGTTITINRELARYDMSVDMFQTRLILGNTESIVQAVIEGIGPAFVSHTSAESALQHGLAIQVPVEGVNLVQRLYMARHTEFFASEVQTAFWDFTFAPENDDLRPVIGVAT